MVQLGNSNMSSWRNDVDMAKEREAGVEGT